MNPTADKYQVLLANVDSAQGHPKVCCICIKKFGFTSGQTPCFRCKRAVCKDCLVERSKVVVVKKNSTETDKKKVCKHCNNEIQAQQSISSLSEGFNKDSVTSIKWLAALGLIPKEDASKISQSSDITPQVLQTVQQTYQKAVEGTIVSMKEVKFKEFILRKTNYSLVQHLHETVTGQKYEEISGVLCRLVNKLAKHYNWERSPLKIDIICLFLLTFASEASTYGIVTRLYESVLPRYFVEFILSNCLNDNSFPKSELWKNQVTQMYQTLQLNSNFDDATKKLSLLFLERYSLDILTSLFINILPFQLAFLSVDALITQHNFQVIENSLISIVIENAEILKEMQGSNYVSMHSFLERTVNPEEISKRIINQLAASSEDSKAKESDKSKGLINPSQFEQNFHDMMLSPQFNILINDNDAQFEMQDDNDDERNQSRQESKQLTSHNVIPENNNKEQLNNSQILPETKTKDIPKEQVNVNSSVQEVKVIDKQLEKALKEEQEKSVQREQVLAQKEQVIAEREQIIAQLRRENEQFTEQLANGQKELKTVKEQLTNQQKQCQELETKATAAIKEKNQILEEVKEERQTPRAQLMEKYKKQIQEQTNLLADLVERSQQTQQQLIADKEKILSESITIKNKLITELSAASEKCLQLTHELEAERNKQDEIKKQGTEKEIELNKQIDEYKRKQAAAQAEKASQMSIYEQKYIGEITVLTRKSEADKSQITQYSQTIASLQSQLAQNISSNKEDIKHFTDQCNIAYLELRKQIEELEFELGSLREQFKKATEQLTSSQAKFDSDLKSYKKQSEDEKASLRDSLDKEKALYLEQNEKEIQSREQLIVELRKRLEYLERSQRADSVRITDEFESSISQLTTEVERLKREKESADREKNAEITSLRLQNTTQAKKIQEQSIELENLNKQILELNSQLQDKIKVISSNQIQITEKDSRISQLEHDLSVALEKLKKSEQYTSLIESLQKELQETKENNSSLEEKIRLLNLQLQLVQSNLDSSNASLNVAKADVEKLQNSILKKDADYSELEKIIQQLKEELQKTKEAYQNLQNEYNKYYSVIQMVKSSITEADK